MDLLNEYIHVDSWSAARGLLSQQPELLSEQAEAFLSEEMDYYKQRGSANIAAGLAVFQAVLRRARVEGMDAALGGLLKDSVTRSFGLLTELVEAGTVEWDVLVFLEAWEDLALTATPIGAVHELFAGTSWDRLGQILRRRHELLERDAVDLVERLASFACKQEDHVACWVLQTVSRLLQDYQAAGVDETLAAWTSVPDAARPAGGHEGIVLPLELALLLGRRALMLLRQEVPAEAAARAWHELGMVYTKRVRGNRADNLEQAISCYHSGLAVLPRKVAPDRRASLLHDLGVCYAQRERGNPADNVERAIRCYAEALKVFDREASPLLWATTQASLGDA